MHQAMPLIRSSLASVRLDRDLSLIEQAIETRTEIRKAKKHGITIQVFEGTVPLPVQHRCEEMLRALLARELVPFDVIFSKIISDPKNIVLVAYHETVPVSFICLAQQSRNPLFRSMRTAVLELSATDERYRNYCPNYALIWEAICFTKERNFERLNLGLLTYTECPDPDLERVAFFKRKWSIEEIPQEESVGYFKYFYLRFLKRYKTAKRVVYFMNVLSGFVRSR